LPVKPKILHREILASTRLFRIESLDLEFSNGTRCTFERLARGSSSGAVLIVPMLDDQTVLLIREYAAGVERYEIGLPKGKTERDEPILSAAERELKEEVGYGARDLKLLSSLTVAPGYLEHSTNIIVARDLYEERLPGDEPEELEVIPWKINNIEGLIATGDCSEARSIAALYMTKEYLNGKKF